MILISNIIMVRSVFDHFELIAIGQFDYFLSMLNVLAFILD